MNRFFCSSVPYAMIVGPINPSPSEFAIGGASTRAISSQNSDCSISVAPRPPYSLGQETAAHPPSYHFRCHAPRYGNDSSSGFSRHSPQSLGTLASSQVLNSSRNLVSSGVRFRSIQQSFQKAAATHAPKIRNLFRYFLRARTQTLRPNLCVSSPASTPPAPSALPPPSDPAPEPPQVRTQQDEPRAPFQSQATKYFRRRSR